MKRAGLLGLVAVAVALTAPGPSAGALGDLHGFIVPPGVQAIGIQCAGAGPLENVRFVFGGPADLKILMIQGNLGTPGFFFISGASPHELTVFFAQNPVPESESPAFNISVLNPLDRNVRLTVAVFCD